ncbi:MAG: ATP-dependent DNA helicase RecG [Candidatus Magasanikbacteria bacterium]
MIDLSAKIIALNRVGKTLARRFKYLGIVTAQDLLFYFPFRYEDYRQIVPIKDLSDGAMVTVQAKIELIANRRSWKKHKMITEALVADDTGSVRVVWFNQPYIAKTLKIGDAVFLSGKVKSDMLGSQLVNPMYEKVGQGDSTHTARLVPIYPLTAGITQKQLRFLMGQVIGLAESAKEWLPDEILEKYDLVDLPHALRGVHFPHDENDLKQSTNRLKFGELFLLQMKAARARLAKVSQKASILTFPEAQIKEFVKGLPFALTRAQKVAAWEILQDLAKPTPMNRLLSGDVGSGKTVVAAMAMYSAALNGYQAVLMAPTEILARQHYDSVSKMLGDKVSIGLLTRSQIEKSQIQNDKLQINSKLQITKIKKDLLNNIKLGEIKIVIGTHTLLSEKVEFQNLGLTIIDEQHRFGVEQRKTIKEKMVDADTTRSHFLSMTATPIPRSLALLLYGDLELSVLNEMPPGRKKIITKLVEPAKRAKAYDFIDKQVKAGRQVFVVCPLIEEQGIKNKEKSEMENNNSLLLTPYSFVSEKKSVMSEYEKLSKKIFPDLRVAYLHGKLKEKDEVMRAFKDDKYDILISTSVVEVGVDVPNASVMMIEGADRFGLAQLHQFRGRVGRAEHQSYCLLFTDNNTARVQERLRYFEQHHDGFKLAEKDLEMRGPGEVYGTQQSGMMNLRLATLADRDLIKKARESAQEIIAHLDKFPILKKKVEKFGKEVHLE